MHFVSFPRVPAMTILRDAAKLNAAKTLPQHAVPLQDKAFPALCAPNQALLQQVLSVSLLRYKPASCMDGKQLHMHPRQQHLDDLHGARSAGVFHADRLNRACSSQQTSSVLHSSMFLLAKFNSMTCMCIP